MIKKVGSAWAAAITAVPLAVAAAASAVAAQRGWDDQRQPRAARGRARAGEPDLGGSADEGGYGASWPLPAAVLGDKCVGHRLGAGFAAGRR